MARFSPSYHAYMSGPWWRTPGSRNGISTGKFRPGCWDDATAIVLMPPTGQ